MIKIKLLRNNNFVKKIIISGHALYDDYGKDIVCAAVSSTVITSVNASLAIDGESVNYAEGNGLIIQVNKDDVVTQKIFESMISNLKQLAEAYSKNIQIKEENNE